MCVQWGRWAAGPPTPQAGHKHQQLQVVHSMLIRLPPCTCTCPCAPELCASGCVACGTQRGQPSPSSSRRGSLSEHMQEATCSQSSRVGRPAAENNLNYWTPLAVQMPKPFLVCRSGTQHCMPVVACLRRQRAAFLSAGAASLSIVWALWVGAKRCTKCWRSSIPPVVLPSDSLHCLSLRPLAAAGSSCPGALRGAALRPCWACKCPEAPAYMP